MNLPVRVLAALLLASASSFAAGVPAQLVYQGRLLKADGSPVAQAIPLTFALYESANSGSPLWSESHSVDPSDGFFEVVLGDGTDASATSDISLASVIDGRQLWLGIKAGSDPEMSPRTVVGSAPYAMLAQPVAHAQTHMKGGGDEIASYDAAADRIPMAGPSGTLDRAWLPLVPVEKGGTGSATPRITRNLCVYVATTNVPTPTIPLAPDLKGCVATRAFASARLAPNATWTFNSTDGQLFAPLDWTADTRMDTSISNVSLRDSDVIAAVITPKGVFHEATFCLEISCVASF
ncbi:MAG: hypothetical protein ACJ79P_10745 [Myxococcales bacterium]